jgi:Mg2+/citrate symporter
MAQSVRRHRQKQFWEYIMNQINLVERLAQGLLAVTIVFAIGLVFQLALAYESGALYAI